MTVKARILACVGLEINLVWRVGERQFFDRQLVCQDSSGLQETFVNDCCRGCLGVGIIYNSSRSLLPPLGAAHSLRVSLLFVLDL